MLVKNFNAAKQQINGAIMAACEEIGKAGTGQIQAIAPIDTGNLRRSYGYKIEAQNKTYVIMFGTNIVNEKGECYAIFVEMKPESRGGRPHLRKAIESEINEFIGIISKHLGRIG